MSPLVTHYETRCLRDGCHIDQQLKRGEGTETLPNPKNNVFPQRDRHQI